MAEPVHNRMARRLEMRPVADLVPYEGNARQHSSAQIDQIAGSIAELGFNNPVLIDAKCRVIAGHGRIEAAKRLGIEQVPVVVLDHLSDAERRAYLLADNRIALNATWDPQLLHEELLHLDADGFDLEIAGFSDEDIARLQDDMDEMRLRELQGQGDPGNGGGGGSGDDDQHTDDMVPFNVVIDRTQREAVYRAVNQAKELYDTKHSGEALYLICQRWSSET